jgi:spermidine synthase
MDVVEIDPAVVRVAGLYFDFKPDERMRVIEADGRVFVKRALREGRKYDLIMLDAFDHEYIPEHLLTREFLGEVKALLAPRGIVAANTFSSSRLYDHESVTYAAVFGEYFNLKRANRAILYQDGGLPTRDSLPPTPSEWRNRSGRWVSKPTGCCRCSPAKWIGTPAPRSSRINIHRRIC